MYRPVGLLWLAAWPATPFGAGGAVPSYHPSTRRPRWGPLPLPCSGLWAPKALGAVSSSRRSGSLGAYYKWGGASFGF